MQDGACSNLITGEIESPYSNSNDRLREMEWRGGKQAFLLNDQVLYRMPSSYYHGGGSTSLVYRIVPLAGGTPKEFFELRWFEEAGPQSSLPFKTKALIAARVTDQVEFLLLAETPQGEKGLYRMFGSPPDPDQLELWVQSPDLWPEPTDHNLNVRFLPSRIGAISADWKRLMMALPETEPGLRPWQVVEIVEKPGQPVAELQVVTTIPASVGLMHPTFSPDGRFIAGVRSERGPGEWDHQLVAIDLQRPEKFYVLADSAVDYSLASWSPDGRYLAIAVLNRYDSNDENKQIRIVELATPGNAPPIRITGPKCSK